MDGFVYLVIASVLLSLIGIFNNGVFMGVILRNRELRTPTNYILLSMSVGDLIVSTIVFPISLGSFRRLFRTYYSCLIAQIVIPSAPQVTAFHLLTVTGERFVGVLYPLRYHTIVTPRRLMVALGLSWGIPVVMSSLPLMGWARSPENLILNGTTRKTCDVFDVLPCTYLSFMVVPEFVVSVIVLILYLCIYREAVKQTKRIAQLSGPLESGHVAKRELKSAQIIFLTVGFFLVSVLPVCAGVLLDCNDVEIQKEIWFAIMFLCFANSLINPLIYGLGNRTIRQKMRLSVCPRFPSRAT